MFAGQLRQGLYRSVVASDPPLVCNEHMLYTHSMRFYFSRSARRHKIGKSHALAALNQGTVPTVEVREHEGEIRTYLEWVAVDDRGIELEIAGRVADEDPDLVVIIHVMPTEFRKD